MVPRLYVATRKGLKPHPLNPSGSGAGAWSITDMAFPGQNLPIVHTDQRTGTVYAAIDHGHFGNKLQRSRDRGKTWEECARLPHTELPPGEETGGR